MLKKFHKSQTGSMMPVFVLCLGAIAALIAVAVSLSTDTSTRNSLQSDADNAALAGAIAFMNDPVTGKKNTRTANAETVASQFAYNTDVENVRSVNAVAVSDDTLGQSAIIEVEIIAAPPRGLAGWAEGSKNPERRVTAQAEATTGLPLCAVALDSTGLGLKVKGSGALNAPDCMFWSNSVSATAMEFSGSGSAVAQGFCAAGTVYVAPGYPISPYPETSCQPVSDPLVSWVPPVAAACTNPPPKHSTSTITLDPGTYCGGLTLNADTIILNPGVYVIQGGSLKLTGNVDVTGTGVGILLSGAGAQLDVKGSATLTLSAADSGPMAGVVLAEDRTTTPGTVSKFNGGSTLNLEGIVYLPNQELVVQGGGDLNLSAASLQFVAKSFEVGGGGNINVVKDETIPDLKNSIATTSYARLVN